ncbi:MAG: hypothetical protein CMM41_05805 [Rhodospirillaceae bacterium]|mgnify:FL=1|nr:hypothetical protein [Rhodospirillaceae bacterium]|tara:strand:- start:1475 stop:1768 length:294 start_codon:yes stop_codon:yes gene_type:complete
MPELEVFDPTGAIEIKQLHAARFASLNGKKIGLVSNDEWQAHRTLPLVGDLLRSKCKDIEVLAPDYFPVGNDPIDTEELVKVAQDLEVDAIIVGNAA